MATFDVAKTRAVWGLGGYGTLQVARLRAQYEGNRGITLQVSRLRASNPAAMPLAITIGVGATADPFDVVYLTPLTAQEGDIIKDADTYLFQEITGPNGAVKSPPTVKIVPFVGSPWLCGYRAPAKFTPSTLYFRATVTRAGVTAVAERTDTIRAHSGFFQNGVGVRVHVGGEGNDLPDLSETGRGFGAGPFGSTPLGQ